MADVEIKFEREDRDGVVAVGTYLLDAMKRVGIRTAAACVLAEGEHYCAVIITNGSEKLSLLTADEVKYFEIHGRGEGERLACQAMIEKAGGISVMTKEKKDETRSGEQATYADYRKEFADMPLEKKIASLIQLEAIALGETFSFVINSPFKIFDKIGDVMAEFGVKLENESKAAGRPKEHSEKASGGSGSETKEAKTGSGRAKKPKG